MMQMVIMADVAGPVSADESKQKRVGSLQQQAKQKTHWPWVLDDSSGSEEERSRDSSGQADRLVPGLSR